MASAISTNPNAMVTRLVLRDGASTNSLLAQVAKTRGEMLAAQAEEARSETPSKALLTPTNGAEVDLLV
jgi:hypothetical protein